MTVRILAIEDDPGIGTLLRRGLELAGYEVRIMTDGRQGVSAWREGGYSLVLLDVMLPDADGLELLAERRSWGDTTPVVLITAREEAELRDRASAAGASAHLAKPFAYADLLDCVRRFASDPSIS